MGTSSSKEEGSLLGLCPLQLQEVQFDPRPTSLVQCLNSQGNLQALPYLQYCQRQDEQQDSLAEFLNTFLLDDQESTELESRPKKRTKKEPIVE
jgi:hypothetical protein